MKMKTLVGSLALLGLASHALAQTPQRIEITGSSIKRIQNEGALPLQTITRAEIDRQIELYRSRDADAREPT